MEKQVAVPWKKKCWSLTGMVLVFVYDLIFPGRSYPHPSVPVTWIENGETILLPQRGMTVLLLLKIFVTVLIHWKHKENSIQQDEIDGLVIFSIPVSSREGISSHQILGSFSWISSPSPPIDSVRRELLQLNWCTPELVCMWLGMNFLFDVAEVALRIIPFLISSL